MPLAPATGPFRALTRVVEAAPENIITLTSLNEFTAREGEAPAEPWRHDVRIMYLL